MAVQISGNDITVPRDGTFSRNVSIAGTLTYEDVTNVDSIGLVTARNGIEVGASPGVAASISVDGNAIFSGITTIGGNVKVGSGITLSPDGDAFHTGVVTATSFVGDGSGLTGAGPTLANGADNRVVTATGANALNAEANLFFNGSQLGVNVTPDSGVHLHVQNSGEANMILEGDVNGQGGFLMLKNNSDNANTTMSIQNLDAGGQGTSEISFKNLSNANNEGEMSLKTRPSGGSMTEQMNISSAGYITMPNRPIFSGRANISNAMRTATETMQLTSRVNVGNHWSNSNYNFTCPVTGYYFMSCSTISNVESYLFFRKDTGSGFASIYTSSHSYGRGDNGNYRVLAATHIESCNAGDKLEFYAQGGYYGLEHGSAVIYLLA